MACASVRYFKAVSATLKCKQHVLSDPGSYDETLQKCSTMYGGLSKTHGGLTTGGRELAMSLSSCTSPDVFRSARHPEGVSPGAWQTPPTFLTNEAIIFLAFQMSLPSTETTAFSTVQLKNDPGMLSWLTCGISLQASHQQSTLQKLLSHLKKSVTCDH